MLEKDKTEQHFGVKSPGREQRNSVGAAARCWDVQQLPDPAGPGAVTLQGILQGKGSVALLGPSEGWLRAGSPRCCTLSQLLAPAEVDQLPWDTPRHSVPGSPHGTLSQGLCLAGRSLPPSSKASVGNKAAALTMEVRRDQRRGWLYTQRSAEDGTLCPCARPCASAVPQREEPRAHAVIRDL